MDHPFWLFLWTNITRTFASVLKFETIKGNQGKKELIVAEHLQLSPVLGFVLPDNNASWRGRQDGDVTRKFPWLLRDIFAHRLHFSVLLFVSYNSRLDFI
jgi:hypothetical protein